ncbi:RPC82 [Candida theae]|uniref:DNA-directed RNA polymerase III subunit RPC3 n=1 Tax=Candida theae TaxID=1198502 RepID=A0AAD5BJ71_9ASCO|nr:RPC82 [Candida theae]KAI5967617.1 RPC82 [Candida theae]
MEEDGFETVRSLSPKSYLYTSIASTHLGEVASKIISTLISHGRQTVKELSQRTQLTLKSVKSALVSLIQLSCVFFWQEEKDKSTYYSLNELGLKILINSGDILNHITQEYGEEEAEAVQNVMELGHIKLEEYLKQYDLDKSQRSIKEKIILKLFNDGWLRVLRIYDYHDMNDVWNQIFNDTMKKTPRSATTSEIKRVAEITANSKEKLLQLTAPQSADELYIHEHGLKKLNPELVLSFNLTRFEKHSRTRAFTNLAKSRIGILTSKIFEAGLKSIENNTPDLTHPFLEIDGLLSGPGDVDDFRNNQESGLVAERKIIFTAKDILRYLPKVLDLRDSVISDTSGISVKREHHEEEDKDSGEPTKRMKLENGHSLTTSSTFNSASHVGNVDVDIDDDSKLAAIQQHLQLLASGTNTKFVVEVSPGRYTVSFHHLSQVVKQFNYEALIKATMKDEAFRVLRCIKQLRLADEKAIAQGVLLKEKTVRNQVYQLVKANVVEIQEVPRSADRAASKTFYLFRYKQQPSYDQLVNSLIFDMGEVVNIINTFEQENAILLEKCQRVDVQGHEEEYLIESELKTLHSLQNRKIKNMVRFNRIKSLWDIYNL